MSRKWYILLLILLVVPCTVAAETIKVRIKGVDDGLRTTQQQDYKEAALFAKREAIERAGVKVKALTTAKDFIVQSDYIESQAEAVLLPGYEIIDVGYLKNGVYQVILIGKVRTTEEAIETKELRYAKSLFDRGKKTKAKEIIDNLVKNSQDDKVVAEALYFKVIWGFAADEIETFEKLKSYYPQYNRLAHLETVVKERDERRRREQKKKRLAAKKKEKEKAERIRRAKEKKRLEAEARKKEQIQKQLAKVDIVNIRENLSRNISKGDWHMLYQDFCRPGPGYRENNCGLRLGKYAGNFLGHDLKQHKVTLYVGLMTTHKNKTRRSSRYNWYDVFAVLIVDGDKANYILSTFDKYVEQDRNNMPYKSGSRIKRELAKDILDCDIDYQVNGPYSVNVQVKVTRHKKPVSS